jgi:hypothetical protein
MSKVLGEGEVKTISLEGSATQVLEEARTILPGLQALFGFQLIAVFSAEFSRLDGLDRLVHWSATLLTVIAMGFLMAPAALNRKIGARKVSSSFVDRANGLLALGLIPLMPALSLECYLVSNVIFDNRSLALVTGAVIFVFLSYMWLLLPYFSKRSLERVS